MKRRDIVTRTGAIAAGALVAGCLGGGGGNEGDGNGTTATPTTGQTDLTDITIVMAPGKFPDIAMHQINTESDILEKEMTEAGYNHSVKKTFSGGSLFASGKAQISAVGPIEATQMATERGFDLVHHAKVAPNYQGWYVNADSDYTVEAAGSQQAAVDKIAEDQATVAHGSWGGGHVLADKYVHAFHFDHTFAEEGGDFKVVTLDYSAIPKAIAENRVPVGVTFGTRAAPQLMNGDIVNLYNHQEIIKSNDLGENTLNCWTTKKSFSDEEPEAIGALFRAWKQGVDRVFKNPVEIATSNDVYQEMLEVNNKKQAKWAAEWALTDKHGYEHGQLYDDPTITDEWVSDNEKFLNKGVDIDIVPEDWSDHVTFRQGAGDV